MCKQDSIKLVNQQVVHLEQEQKSLKQRLNRMKYSNTGNYYTEHSRAKTSLQKIELKLEQKRGELEKLLLAQQQSLF